MEAISCISGCTFSVVLLEGCRSPPPQVFFQDGMFFSSTHQLSLPDPASPQHDSTTTVFDPENGYEVSFPSHVVFTCRHKIQFDLSFSITYFHIYCRNENFLWFYLLMMQHLKTTDFTRFNLAVSDQMMHQMFQIFFMTDLEKYASL